MLPLHLRLLHSYPGIGLKLAVTGPTRGCMLMDRVPAAWQGMMWQSGDSHWLAPNYAKDSGHWLQGDSGWDILQACKEVKLQAQKAGDKAGLKAVTALEKRINQVALPFVPSGKGTGIPCTDRYTGVSASTFVFCCHIHSTSGNSLYACHWAVAGCFG